MSELIQKNDNRATIRWKLLTSASALALTAAISSASMAEDANPPPLWIELGGQFEQQLDQGDAFIPSFAANNQDSPVFKTDSPLRAETPPLYSIGMDGKLTFQPAGTDWIFSAGVKFGRSNGKRTTSRSHLATNQAHETFRGTIGHQTFTSYYGYVYTRPVRGAVKKTFPQTITQFAEVQITQRQSHEIIDFAAGKDVGLGMFGSGGTSDISAGVRIAQFVSKVSGVINARPDADFIKGYNTNLQYRFPSYAWRNYGEAFHNYHATFSSQRNFRGIGPTVSWNASLPVAGEQPAGTLNIDWGINAALLFGRQRAAGKHHTSAYFKTFTVPPSIHHTQHTSVGGFNRSRKIIVPNVGGFAGMSFNFPNAKVALGYRGDFFFGAMDAGNDTRQTKTVGFFGPYASISVGLGD